MARYIDADALMKKIVKCKIHLTGGIVYDAGEVQSIINTMPTADVAPKSEVERLTVELEAMRTAANSYKMHYENLAREIFEEIDVMFQKYYNRCSEPTELKLLEPLCQAERFIINEMWHNVAELKEKYTEEK